jgi:hypothetical protein
LYITVFEIFVFITFFGVILAIFMLYRYLCERDMREDFERQKHKPFGFSSWDEFRKFLDKSDC